MTFKLFIMRHAKSDWSGPGISDFDRPINKRGQKNAKRVGQWMMENDLIPQQIVSSPALRAKQTTEFLAEAFTECIPAKIQFDEDLYLASVDTLIESIQLYKNNLNSLMLVAHNPGLEQLVDFLLSKSRHSTVHVMSMTTANLAIFEYLDNSFDPEIDSGELIEFIKPKELD